jgi:hypothetical protein
MAYVVTKRCIRNKHTDCVPVFLLDGKKPSSEDADESATFNDKHASLEFA